MASRDGIVVLHDGSSISIRLRALDTFHVTEAEARTLLLLLSEVLASKAGTAAPENDAKRLARELEAALKPVNWTEVRAFEISKAILNALQHFIRN
jgi:plasmid stability protein